MWQDVAETRISAALRSDIDLSYISIDDCPSTYHHMGQPQYVQMQRRQRGQQQYQHQHQHQHPPPLPPPPPPPRPPPLPPPPTLATGDQAHAGYAAEASRAGSGKSLDTFDLMGLYEDVTRQEHGAMGLYEDVTRQEHQAMGLYEDVTRQEPDEAARHDVTNGSHELAAGDESFTLEWGGQRRPVDVGV